MKNTKKSLRRITATLVAMAASASFAAAPISGAGITFSMPSFSASAADTDVLTYENYSYKVTENGIVITAYNGSEANPVIPSAIDETAVISIGNSAFAENTSITAVTIPSSITTIENKAFKNCTKLEKITIPGNITTIGAEAFLSCTNLKEIEIPSSVTTIEHDAFKNCTSLEKLTLNEGLTMLGSECFTNTKISSVTIPSTLTDVYLKLTSNGGPFAGCELLKDVTIDENTTVIPKFLFKDCTTITEIEIPSSVKKIGHHAFKNCTSLEKLTLNEGLTKLGYEAFTNTKITSVTIPSTLTDVYINLVTNGGPFFGCELLKEVTIDEKATIIPNYLFKNNTQLEKVTIPGNIAEIGTEAFLSCTNLKEIEIPSSVTTIEHDAFKNCTSLEKLTLNEGLTMLGSECFTNTKISSVTIPSTLTDVYLKLTSNGGPFAGCELLKDVTIDENTTVIPKFLFKDCTTITEIEIPSSVKKIGHHAFKNCTSLEKLTLNEGLTKLGYEAFTNTKITSVTIPSTLTDVYINLVTNGGPFAGCELLKDVTINENATTIPNYLFKNCTQLEKITIPGNVVKIGEEAFISCTNLSEIEIPSSVKQINHHAFKDCTKLEKLTLNEGLTKLGFECFTNTKITSVTIPSTLTDVYINFTFNGGPFAGCELLKDITIDENATTIPNYLFKNCTQLETIDIPYFVRNIGNSAFENCSSLDEIIIHNPYCNIYNKDVTISDNATIKGYATSTAENYALTYEREFVSLGSFTLGDVNEDGMIDSSDASMVLAEYALMQTGGEPTFTEIQKISADVNKDYSVDSSDASKILSYYAASSTGKTPSWD